MNKELILSHISGLDCTARLVEAGCKLVVEFVVNEKNVTLIHTFPDELISMPKFYLSNVQDFGKLAHILTNQNDESGEVCITDALSTAINTDQPELAYRDTVDKHLQLLTQLIEDPAYNHAEQLREFDAHWKILCDNAAGGSNELFVVWDGNSSESMQVRPPRLETGSDLQTKPVALAGSYTSDRNLTYALAIAKLETRQVIGKAISIWLSHLEPPPATQYNLLEWYFRIVAFADQPSQRELRKLRKKKYREFWLVFSAQIPNGETMFALHWNACSRSTFPASLDGIEADNWTVTPYRVRSISPSALIPRGGGSLDLKGMSVLLVGCGSVGSEIALRLTSAGVGQLTLSDPDKFSEENLYRHILSVRDIGRLKTEALAELVIQKNPWVTIDAFDKSLQEFRNPVILNKFDLVIVAIGCSNVERVFAEFCNQEAINVPVINCWLEGFGIGGHAIISIPSTKGCWHCAYVDPKTLTRGLTSNLNFLSPGQMIMRNHRGCGTQFLPYNGIAAGYTAAIAADLAVRFLEGQITSSSKVSWKGVDVEAKRASLTTTWRYRHFTDSLHILPLHDNNCDLCVAR